MGKKPLPGQQGEILGTCNGNVKQFSSNSQVFMTLKTNDFNKIGPEIAL
jgi:hypothetical protein